MTQTRHRGEKLDRNANVTFGLRPELVLVLNLSLGPEPHDPTDSNLLRQPTRTKLGRRGDLVIWWPCGGGFVGGADVVRDGQAAAISDDCASGLFIALFWGPRGGEDVDGQQQCRCSEIASIESGEGRPFTAHSREEEIMSASLAPPPSEADCDELVKGLAATCLDDADVDMLLDGHPSHSVSQDGSDVATPEAG
ncbi:hypothetical protein THAOC_13703, partial [Thalassiosira oceanica]